MLPSWPWLFALNRCKANCQPPFPLLSSRARTWAPVVSWPHGGGWEQGAQSGVGGMDECERQGQRGEGVHRNVGERRKNGRQIGGAGSAPAEVPPRAQVALDPGPVGRDPGVHPRESGLSTAPAEAHHRCLHPAPVPEQTDQGAPGVALKEARITNRSSGTQVCAAGVGAPRLRLTSGSLLEGAGCRRQGEDTQGKPPWGSR